MTAAKKTSQTSVSRSPTTRCHGSKLLNMLSSLAVWPSAFRLQNMAKFTGLRNDSSLAIGIPARPHNEGLSRVGMAVSARLVKLAVFRNRNEKGAHLSHEKTGF